MSDNARKQSAALAEIARESPEAAGLVGQIVIAGYESFASATARVDEAKDRQIRGLAADILTMWDIIQSHTVLDRETTERLRACWGAVDNAERIIASAAELS